MKRQCADCGVTDQGLWLIVAGRRLCFACVYLVKRAQS